MIFSSARAPDPAETALRALHLSLNAPVVAVGDRAMGPARAAIAVLAWEGGAPQLCVAVRSTASGEVVFYAPEGEPGVSPESLEAAISFAGAMGFLFDEDDAEPGDAAERLWSEWLGRAAHHPGAAPDRKARTTAVRSAPAVCRELPLTKFRRPPSSSDDPGPEGEEARKPARRPRTGVQRRRLRLFGWF